MTRAPSARWSLNSASTLQESGFEPRAVTRVPSISSLGSPDSEESYSLVVVDRTEVDFVSTTPGTVVRGIGKKQRRGIF